MNILFVDDNEDACEAFEELFLDEGYKIKSVFSGEDAVVCYNGSSYNLVFMDLKMPGMGGLEATRLIRKADPQALIIALTGNTDRGDLREVLKAGAREVIRKPYDPRKILELVRSYIASV